MYIKFCRNYGLETKPPDEANAKLSPESKLSVELEGEKGRPEQFIGFDVFFCVVVFRVT